MSFRQVVAADNEPLTIGETRIHLRQAVDAADPADPPVSLEQSPDDSWVSAKIVAARLWAEAFLGVLLSDATYQINYDAFDDTLIVPTGTASITSVSYLDVSNAIQTIDPADYQLDEETLLIASSPAISSRSGSVRVRVKGEVTVQDDVKHALLLLIGHWYENREATSASHLSTIPMAVESLLRPHRVRLGMA